MDDWNERGPGMRPWHGEGHDHLLGAWHWVGMSIGLAIAIAAVVAAYLVLRRVAGEPRRAAGGTSSPEELLRTRFARGEIDAEEYRSRMQVLAEPQGG